MTLKKAATVVGLATGVLALAGGAIAALRASTAEADEFVTTRAERVVAPVKKDVADQAAAIRDVREDVRANTKMQQEVLLRLGQVSGQLDVLLARPSLPPPRTPGSNTSPRPR